MTTKHTPGPWEKEHTTLQIVRGIMMPDDVGTWQISEKNDTGSVVAYVPSGEDAPSKWSNPASDDYKTSQIANAHLIAAAPDLLAALEGIQHGDCWCGMGIGNPMFSGHSNACLAVSAAIAKARDAVTT